MASWWRHQMDAFSALLAICARNSPVNGEFPTQRPVTPSFGVFFDLRLVNGWVNNGGASDLIRHRTLYDVIVMFSKFHKLSGVLIYILSQKTVARLKEWRIITLKKTTNMSRMPLLTSTLWIIQWGSMTHKYILWIITNLWQNYLRGECAIGRVPLRSVSVLSCVIIMSWLAYTFLIIDHLWGIHRLPVDSSQKISNVDLCF